MDKTISINLNAASIFKAILVIVVFLAAYKLQQLILIVLISVIIASSVEQGTRFLKRLKIGRVWAVLILYISVFAIFFIGLSLILPPLFNDLSNLASGLPEKLNAITNVEPAVDPLSSITGGLAKSFTLSDIIIEIQKFILQLSNSIFSTASVVFGGFFSFVLVLVISFYLSVQERGIENFLRIVTPIKYEDYVLDLWKRSQNKIGLWFQGQLLLGLIVGFSVFLGLWILGVKYAISLGILAGLFEIIPFFGPILAAVPGVLLGFAESGTTGLVVLIFYIAIQQLENHVVYPLVAKKVIGLPPLIVILALLAGWELYGFLGILVSVPLTTILMEMVNDVEKRKIAIKAAAR